MELKISLENIGLEMIFVDMLALFVDGDIRIFDVIGLDSGLVFYREEAKPKRKETTFNHDIMRCKQSCMI